MAANAEKTGGKRGGPWRVVLWSLAALVLLLPLAAMRFTHDVKWTVGDFVFAGALLGGTGIAFELAVKKNASTAYRAAVGVALAAAFLLIWINGAVGIIGSESNRANLMYAGVLAVAIIGAVFARFQSRGMDRALFAAAFAQLLVGAIALAGGLGAGGPIWPLDLLGLTGLFVALFVGSALLFQKAAREQSHACARSQ